MESKSCMWYRKIKLLHWAAEMRGTEARSNQREERKERKGGKREVKSWQKKEEHRCLLRAPDSLPGSTRATDITCHCFWVWLYPSLSVKLWKLRCRHQHHEHRTFHLALSLHCSSELSAVHGENTEHQSSDHYFYSFRDTRYKWELRMTTIPCDQ